MPIVKRICSASPKLCFWETANTVILSRQDNDHDVLLWTVAAVNWPLYTDVQHMSASFVPVHRTSSCPCRTSTRRTPSSYKPNTCDSALFVVVCCSRLWTRRTLPQWQMSPKTSTTNRRPCLAEIPAVRRHWCCAPLNSPWRCYRPKSYTNSAPQTPT